MRSKHGASRLICALGVGTVAFAGAAPPALAGGFGIHDQSAQFLGSAFAGAAAGGALSSMFWNPAAVGQFNGIWSESASTVIIPQTEIHALPGSTFAGVFPSNSGNIGENAILPKGYLSYQISPTMVFGLSINSPFGLVTDPNPNWAGQTLARRSKIETYNAAPTIAYRVTPGFILGAGLQVEYFRTKLLNAAPVGAPPWPNATTKGDDIAIGFTLGALWQPTSYSSVGLGFRSSIDHDLEGTLVFPGAGKSNIATDVQVPEMLTISARHALDPKWTALATVEWTNWSRLDKADFKCRSAGGLCPAPGFIVNTLELGWHDGWLFAAGLEYDYNAKLTLRGGVAYEISPIRDPEERVAQLPDSDQFILSLGASYDLKWCGMWCDNSTLIIGYAHSFYEDASINRTENGVTLLANTQNRADLISIGFRTQWSSGARTVQPIK